MTRRTLLLGALVAAAPAFADTAPTVSAAWARATAGQATNTAVYLTVSAAETDRLVAASTPVASEAMLHENRTVGGVMQMRMLPSIVVTAGEKIVLAPGGLHIMLTGVKAPLTAGGHFPMTLRFEKAGDVAVEVTVEKVGASGPAMAHGMPGMEMPARP